MPENNDIANKYSSILYRDEKIMWVQEGEDGRMKPSCFVILFGVGLLIYWFIAFASGELGTYLTFGLWLSILYGITLFTTYQKESEKKISYILTNKRFIFDDQSEYRSHASYPHHEIYKIYASGNDIILQNDPIHIQQDEEKYPRIINANQYEDVAPTIKKIWFKGSVYQKQIHQFRELARRYYLNFDEDLAYKKLKINLNGTIQGMPISFSLDNMLDLKNLDISCICPNSEKNNLYIGLENSAHRVKKMFGLNDIEIGNSIFDEKYVLNSNNETFLKSILDNSLAERIKKNNDYIKGVFEIYENTKPSKNKVIEIKQDDILDAGLFENNIPKKERHKNHSSRLKYNVDAFMELRNNQKAIEQAMDILETTIILARNIKKYDESL